MFDTFGGHHTFVRPFTSGRSILSPGDTLSRPVARWHRRTLNMQSRVIHEKQWDSDFFFFKPSLLPSLKKKFFITSKSYDMCLWYSLRFVSLLGGTNCTSGSTIAMPNSGGTECPKAAANFTASHHGHPLWSADRCTLTNRGCIHAWSHIAPHTLQQQPALQQFLSLW